MTLEAATGNNKARARLPRENSKNAIPIPAALMAGTTGIIRELVLRQGKDKKYRPCREFLIHYKWGNRWRAARLRELHDSHGYVSAGVVALVNSCAWLYSAAEYANEQGGELADLEMFAQAARFVTAARGNELAAWELCAREAMVFAKTRDAKLQTVDDLLSSIEVTADE